jgi:hypothetical protein
MTTTDDCTVVVDTVPASYNVIEVVTTPIAEFQVETMGPQGQQGEKGDPGDPSFGATVEYQFPVPLYTWEGNHPFVGKPTVILLDENDEQFLGRVTYPQSRYSQDSTDLGLVVVLFSVPMSGTMVIRA